MRKWLSPTSTANDTTKDIIGGGTGDITIGVAFCSGQTPPACISPAESSALRRKNHEVWEYYAKVTLSAAGRWRYCLRPFISSVRLSGRASGGQTLRTSARRTKSNSPATGQSETGG